MDTNTLNQPTAAMGRDAAEARRRVTRGAALFDGIAPGWAGRMNTADLDVLNPHHCPLAQLVGMIDVPASKLARATRLYGGDPTPYIVGLAMFLPADVNYLGQRSSLWASRRGFTAGWRNPDPATVADVYADIWVGYPATTRAWLNEIMRRRTAVVVVTS